jgi:cytidylate kinase
MIITISNEYGAGAVAIAQRVARKLGYELVDSQLPVVVAKRLAVSPEDVEAAEDSRRSIGERLIEGLEIATPEVAQSKIGDTFDDQMFREIQAAVREAALHGNVMIVGRAANLILGRRDDILRVFMHAPRAWRIEHVVENLGVDEAAAAAEVDRVDAARRSYVRDWYDATWGDPQHYDLSLDTARFGPDGSVAVIVAAARASDGGGEV